MSTIAALRHRRILVIAVMLSLAGASCGMIKPRVIVDGKHYDIDGTPREQPTERANNAIKAMRECTAEVAAARDGFARDTRPALVALGSDDRGSGKFTIALAEDAKDPLIRVQAGDGAPTDRSAKTDSKLDGAAEKLSQSLRKALN